MARQVASSTSPSSSPSSSSAPDSAPVPAPPLAKTTCCLPLTKWAKGFNEEKRPRMRWRNDEVRSEMESSGRYCE